MKNYVVIYEKSVTGYSAYLPDLPGCTSAGATRAEVKKNIMEAIKLYFEVIEESGGEIPKPNSESETLLLE